MCRLAPGALVRSSCGSRPVVVVFVHIFVWSVVDLSASITLREGNILSDTLNEILFSALGQHYTASRNATHRIVNEWSPERNQVDPALLHQFLRLLNTIPVVDHQLRLAPLPLD